MKDLNYYKKNTLEQIQIASFQINKIVLQKFNEFCINNSINKGKLISDLMEDFINNQKEVKQT